MENIRLYDIVKDNDIHRVYYKHNKHALFAFHLHRLDGPAIIQDIGLYSVWNNADGNPMTYKRRYTGGFYIGGIYIGVVTVEEGGCVISIEPSFSLKTNHK
jgi:hypothetical protein